MPSEDQISPARKLVTVRPIASVTSFNSVHNIVTIDGWTVAVKKTEGFKTGEYVVYFEVDAFLPASSTLAPLFHKALGQTTGFHGQQGYRVGTRDIMNHKPPMRSAISQGLVFKLGCFPQINNDVLRRRAALKPNDDFVAIMRNFDYSAELGITKWESQTDPDTGNWPIPSFIKRTTTERVQNCPNLFIKPKYRTFVFQESVKLDGRSMTCYFVHRGCHLYPTLHSLGPSYEKNAILPNGRFGVCSKSCELSNAVPNPYWETALELRLHKIMSLAGLSIAIQGELVGWNIQGNPYNYPENKRDFFVYTVVDVETRERWHPKDVKSFADDLGLKHVEVLGYTTLPSIAKNHKGLLDRADKRGGEGLVFKCCDDNRWFKVLSNKYILKKGDEARAVAEEKARTAVKNNNYGAVSQRFMTAAHHDKKLVAETKHVAPPHNSMNKAAQEETILCPRVGGSQLASQSTTKAPTKSTTQAHTSTNALVAVPRSLEKKPVSFEEAAGLIVKPQKEDAVVKTARQLEKISSDPSTAPILPTKAAAVKIVQQSETDKTSSALFTAPPPTKEEATAVENSKVSPLTSNLPIIPVTGVDISSRKQDTLPVPTSESSHRSATYTEAQPIKAAPHTQAQPITAAASTHTKTATHESGNYKTSNTPRAETKSTTTNPPGQPVAAAPHTKAAAHEPGYYKMDKANFDHFTQTCFAAEAAGTHAWLNTWSTEYLQTHGKPLTFDSAGKIVNASPSQLPTPAENQTSAPPNGSRWTNSRLRHNSTPAAPARETNPVVADKPRWVSASIDLAEEAPQVHTSIKKSITLTTRDVDGRLVRVKISVTTGTLPDASASRPTTTPRGVAPSSTGATTTVPGLPVVTPRVPPAVVAAGAAVHRAAEAVTATVSAADTITTTAIVPAADAATAATMATTWHMHQSTPLPVGGEQTMSGRYRGFAEWLGIGGGGVDDVCQR